MSLNLRKIYNKENRQITKSSNLYKLAQKNELPITWSDVRSRRGYLEKKTEVVKAELETHRGIKKYKIPTGEIRNQLYTVRDLIIKSKYKKFHIALYCDNKMVKKHSYEIPDDKSVHAWWNDDKIYLDWLVSSQITWLNYVLPLTHAQYELFQNNEDELIVYLTENFEEGQTNEKYIIISKELDIPALAYNQLFREGETHCFFNPIMKWAEDMLEKEKQKDEKSRRERKYNSMIKYINENISKYEEGITQEDIEKVSTDISIGVDIKDYLGCEWINIRPKQHAIKVFSYLNSRDNHVDIDTLCSNQDKEIINRDVMIDKIFTIKENKEYYRFKGTDTCPSLLITSNKMYQLDTTKNEYDIYNKFETDMGFIQYCKVFLDTPQEYKLYSTFVKNSIHVGGCVDYVEITDELRNSNTIKQVDQTKSYTQHKNCPYYQGFIPKISDYRLVPDNINQKEFLKQHLGIYEIVNINIENCNENTKKHIEMLNLFTTQGKEDEERIYVFTSPELLFYLDNNVEFDIVQGAWCSTPFHFDYPEYMFNKIDPTDKLSPPFYSKWAGMTGKINDTEKINVFCSVRMAQDIKQRHQSLKVKAYETDEKQKRVEIEIPKATICTYNHIFSFITSYARIHLLNQLFSINASQIIRVNMDGIYYTGDIEIKPTFTQKYDKGKEHLKITTIAKNCSTERYMSYYNIKHKRSSQEYIQNNRITVKIGCGGSGKTHSILTDKGYINVYYTTESWKLTTEKTTEYKCKGSVWAVVLDEQNIKSIFKYQPAVIIVDEATLLTDDRKKTFIKMYPYSKIIFCGDFNKKGNPYQLTPVGFKPMTFKKIDYVDETHINTNYRTTDIILLELLSKLRKLIDKKTDQTTTIKKLTKYFKETDQIVNKEYVEKNYKIDDYILCSRRTCNICKEYHCGHKDGHNYVQEWTNTFKGKFTNEKYFLTSNTSTTNNGDIIISDVKPTVKHEIRHAFTVHSIQGTTIKENTIYIDSRNFFDPNMAYVAVSRATSINQIKYII